MKPIENTAKDVEGHPPIRYENEGFICPERGRVVPEFRVGPEEYHRQLFIEYERTFGRGKAKYITHGNGAYVPGTESEKQFNERYGKGVLEEYSKLTGVVPLMNIGNEEQCHEAIEELKDYRRRHPGLYDDIVDINAPKKKFKIT